MARLPTMASDTASQQTKRSLYEIATLWDVSPEMISLMAHAPAVLQGYLSLRDALSNGVLGPRLGTQLALMIAEANRSSYCVAVHVTVGRLVGIDEAELQSARAASSSNPKTEAALRFARKIVDYRGELTDEEFNGVREAGYTDEEIAEIIGNVALNIFTNYFNLVAQTDLNRPLEGAEGPNVA
jgi:AhpD family alkylhydroperoxidase